MAVGVLGSAFTGGGGVVLKEESTGVGIASVRGPQFGAALGVGSGGSGGSGGYGGALTG